MLHAGASPTGISLREHNSLHHAEQEGWEQAQTVVSERPISPWKCTVQFHARASQQPHFLDQTARKPKVRLETMAEMKPVQLKVRSDADASATPVCPRPTQPHTVRDLHPKQERDLEPVHRAWGTRQPLTPPCI